MKICESFDIQLNNSLISNVNTSTIAFDSEIFGVFFSKGAKVMQ